MASIETRRLLVRTARAYAVEKGQIGDENKGGPDRQPDPLPETDCYGQSKRREKEGGNKGDRQQKKGP